MRSNSDESISIVAVHSGGDSVHSVPMLPSTEQPQEDDLVEPGSPEEKQNEGANVEEQDDDVHSGGGGVH